MLFTIHVPDGCRPFEIMICIQVDFWCLERGNGDYPKQAKLRQLKIASIKSQIRNENEMHDNKESKSLRQGLRPGV